LRSTALVIRWVLVVGENLLKLRKYENKIVKALANRGRVCQI
jgi:hypothetical protein